MTDAAKLVLKDCELALTMLEEEERTDRWRLLWIAGVSALRTVGDVLDKIDSKVDPAVAKVIRSHYRQWIDVPGPDNDMFDGFIRSERNDLVHLHRFGPSDADEHILIFDDSSATVESDLFRPLEGGPFAGEDARDVFADAIQWWHLKLSEIDAELLGQTIEPLKTIPSPES